MSRLREIELVGVISTESSTVAPLGIGGVFNNASAGEDVTDFGTIEISVYSDVASATDGLSIQFSSDGTNWDHTDVYTVPAATGKNYSIQRVAKHFRIVYTNGGIAQTEFRLQAILNQFYVKPSSHRLSDPIIAEDDAELTTAVLKIGGGDPEVFNNVGTNHPMPTTADSVYESDIDVANSDNGGFSGSVTDYFNDLFSVNSDASATNPKTIKIWFRHSIQLYSIGFGCNESGKSFSNIKIMLFGSDEFIREIVDDSADSTKHTSLVFDIAPSKANGVIIEFHTADEICLSNLIIWKVQNVNSRLSATSDLTGNVEDIKSFRGALNVHLADVHNFVVNTNFHQHDTAITTISTASDAGDTSIVVADTAGFSVDDVVELIHTDGVTREINGAIITVIAAGTPGTLTLDRPLDNAYSVGSIVERLVFNIAAGVLGTLADPLSFQVAPPAGEIWHIQRIMISATFATAPDDGDFGDGTALVNGLVLRQNLSTGLFTTSVWKTNGDIKLDIFDLPYTDKGPGGTHGMNGRFTNKKLDVSYELHGDDGDFLEVLRQDNIAITTFEMKAQGHKASE